MGKSKPALAPVEAPDTGPYAASARLRGTASALIQTAPKADSETERARLPGEKGRPLTAIRSSSKSTGGTIHRIASVTHGTGRWFALAAIPNATPAGKNTSA